jgi:hypothetical protein
MKTLPKQDLRSVTGGMMGAAHNGSIARSGLLVKEINPQDFTELWEGLFKRQKHFLDHLRHY